MVTIKAKNAKSLLNKTKGLIGKKTIEPLYFETRFGIHTFGVREPIDIVILDKHNRIVTLKEYLKPNRIFLWNPLFKKVVELPKGTIKSKRLTLGAIIEVTG